MTRTDRSSPQDPADRALTGPQAEEVDDSLVDADPREVLAIVDRQQRVADRRLDVDARALYLIWGAAWIAGFTALYLGWGYDRDPVLVPWIGGAVFAALLLGAFVVTAVHSARASRGLRGPSTAQAAMYGWGWFLGFAAMSMVGGGLVRAGLDGELAALYYSGASGLVVGLMYVCGGALWHDRLQFALGGWLLLVFGGATLLGGPTNYLVEAVLGGGAFVVAGLLTGRGTRSRDPR